MDVVHGAAKVLYTSLMYLAVLLAGGLAAMHSFCTAAANNSLKAEAALAEAITHRLIPATSAAARQVAGAKQPAHGVRGCGGAP